MRFVYVIIRTTGSARMSYYDALIAPCAFTCDESTENRVFQFPCATQFYSDGKFLWTNLTPMWDGEMWSRNLPC